MITWNELEKNDLMLAYKFHHFNVWLNDNDWVNYVDPEIWINLKTRATRHIENLWKEYASEERPKNI